MLSYTLDVLIVALTITSSMLLMWALDRLWPWEKRHAHNDLIGWQLSILGTTYAVILGSCFTRYGLTLAPPPST
jgi:hypothetical protein